MKNSLRKYGIVIALIFLLVLCGCARSLAKESSFAGNVPEPEEEYNIYLSSARLIYRGFDSDSSMIDFYKMDSDELMSLGFTGATEINDEYGQPMSIVMLQPGDIVNVAYNGTVNLAGAIVECPEIETISDVTHYSVSENGQSMTVGDETYSLSEYARFFSDGKDISSDQLINKDSLTVKISDRTICTVRVDEGHGYLELTNEDALVGGWIEIGQTVISQVMSDMLFTVPEGHYTVRLTNTGIEEYREVDIARNEVTELNLGDIESYAPEKGVVTFNVSPDSASVYVDGTYVETVFPIRLPVGIHEVTVASSGFDSVTQYFEVTGINQVVTVDLVSETALNSVSGNNINKNLYATITVESPVDVEVFEDNIYKGITPVSYQKTAGTHTLTLHKPGYVTTSYTIVVSDDGKDQTFSFPELEPERTNETVSGNSLDSKTESSGSQSTVSGNSVSGNSVSGNSADSASSSSSISEQ